MVCALLSLSQQLKTREVKLLPQICPPWSMPTGRWLIIEGKLLKITYLASRLSKQLFRDPWLWELGCNLNNPSLA